ncbi:MAG: CPXCG motif-containing cysteine-rich protein [Acidobacteria bacterium]|nr:CPXCG motif-containing cysteine-rich protein [Acidobacteriota bacterium]
MIEDVIVDCPSCGEAMALSVDTTAGAEQSYVQDCPVCCRPMEVYVQCRPGTVLSVSVSAE